jgi:hypothetical protein
MLISKDSFCLLVIYDKNEQNLNEEAINSTAFMNSSRLSYNAVIWKLGIIICYF